MVWLHRSPIPLGRKMVFHLFKWRLPAFAAPIGRGGGVSILCLQVVKCRSKKRPVECSCNRYPHRYAQSSILRSTRRSRVSFLEQNYCTWTAKDKVNICLIYLPYAGTLKERSVVSIISRDFRPSLKKINFFFTGLRKFQNLQKPNFQFYFSYENVRISMGTVPYLKSKKKSTALKIKEKGKKCIRVNKNWLLSKMFMNNN